MHEAVDGLQAAAIASGLVDAMGPDAVQTILAQVFGGVRDDLAQPAISRETEPSWSEAALKYHERRGKRAAVVEIEPQRLECLRQLLADDVSLERAHAELSKPVGVARSTLKAAEFLACEGDLRCACGSGSRSTTPNGAAQFKNIWGGKHAAKPATD